MLQLIFLFIIVIIIDNNPCYARILISRGTALTIFVHVCLFFADHSLQSLFSHSFSFAIPFFFNVCKVGHATCCTRIYYTKILCNSCTTCRLAYRKNRSHTSWRDIPTYIIPTLMSSTRRGPVLMHVGKVSARRGRSAHICADHDYARFSLSLSYLFCSFISLDPWSPSTGPFVDLRFPTNPHRESNEIYLYLEIPVSRICAIIHPKFA